jgi:hypothetical protein
MDINYTPPPVLRRFMMSDARVRIVRGPVGSGKSTAMATELLRRAAQQAPGADGIRRTRGVIVRNTLSQLESTALETLMAMYRPILNYKPSDKTVELRLGDIHADWILMPLDRPENVQRLLSLEITYAWLSELRELQPQILLDVFSRCGRFPSKMHGGPTWYGVFGETNSFSEDSDWFPILEGFAPDKSGAIRPKPNWEYFLQPGAREPGAENTENLVSTYYEDLIANNSPEWVEQYVDNKITPSLSGESVFRASFRHDFHISSTDLSPVPGAILLIGMDFGRNPTALLTQMDARGRILVLDECLGDNMGVEQFITNHLRPLLSQPEYSRLAVGVVGDPAGNQRGQIGEESIFKALNRLGFAAQPAQTNQIEPRLRAVEKWFMQQRDGKAALLISPRCKMLIKALGSKYRYARRKDGELQPVPEKSHPWSDLGDALQYAVLGHTSKIVSRFMRPRHDNNQPRPSASGWT